MDNKIKILVVLSIVMATILSGCVTGSKTIQTPEGKVTIEDAQGGKEGKGSDWCQSGMKVTSSAPEGEGAYEIKGITTYEGKSVCEAEMKVSGISGEEKVWKYYFTENGEYAVIIMKDSTGKEQKVVVSNQNS